MRPKRTSAVLAVERMQKIARWEACSENSAEFRAAAAQIDAELQSETRRGVVKVTDIDDDVDGEETPDNSPGVTPDNTLPPVPGHVHYASTEAPGADDSDVDSAAADESDEYESSFIDDDELSSVEGSESCASSMCETSESSEGDSTNIEADAGVDNVVEDEADVDKMLQELPGASENFEDCLGPWPLDESVNYSHDDCGLDSLEALDSHRDLCDLDESEIFKDNN